MTGAGGRSETEVYKKPGIKQFVCDAIQLYTRFACAKLIQAVITVPALPRIASFTRSMEVMITFPAGLLSR